MDFRIMVSVWVLISAWAVILFLVIGNKIVRKPWTLEVPCLVIFLALGWFILVRFYKPGAFYIALVCWTVSALLLAAATGAVLYDRRSGEREEKYEQV